MEPQSPGSDCSTSSTRSTRDKDIVHQLTELLRANGRTGERILSGQSKLSLTTKSLCVLNEQFTHLLGEEEFITSFDVVPPNSPKIPYVQDIQFLYDFMQKTIALKILHVSSTLQGRVNLSSFRALKILEIKKTPLHLLEGIQRMRGRLTTIICARSLSTLQELFESCGGDLSSPMSWPELRIACLSFNMIEILDSSLRLVPNLEVLDLSHNSISETDRYLEYLTELVMLNLGYNKLTQVPTMAISVREKLSTLILRNNDIDTLKGIEELTGLKDLDAADNCMCDHHQALAPLRHLKKLSMVILTGNPLSFHRDHRLLTLTTIHNKAATKISIDGRQVSEVEVQASQKFPSPSTIQSRSGGNRHEGHRPYLSEVSMDSSPQSGTQSETDTPQKGKSTLKPGRAGRKVRRALISDLDSGCDAESDMPEPSPESSKPSTPLNYEHLDVKKHMESMRAQLGPDWLQTLVTNKTTSSKDDNSQTPQLQQTKPQSPPQTIKSQSANGHDMVDTTPVLSGERVAKFAIGSIDDEDEGNFEARRPQRNSPYPEVTYNYISTDGLKASVKEEDSISDHIEMFKSCEDEEEEEVRRTAANVMQKSIDIHDIYGRQTSLVDEVDYGQESEPFIVSHLGDTDVNRLLNVTNRYLLEKDINGEVLEALDLKCLLNVEVMAVGAMAHDGVLDGDQSQEDGPVIKLSFDYVKKDKRERTYVMEDESSSEGFLAMLNPVVEVNKTAANARNQMQCLKCNKEFSKHEAGRTIKRQGSVQMSMDTYASSIEIGDLKETLLCPNCSSEMVIKIEVSHSAYGSAVETPIGSFKEPMATSSANPSPWKQENPSQSESPLKSITSSSFKSFSGANSIVANDAEVRSHSLSSPTFHTPKDTFFHTPPSVSPMSDSKNKREQTTDTSFKSITNDDVDNNNSGSSRVTKAPVMSLSAIEMPTQECVQNAAGHTHESMTTPVENKAFQRNTPVHENGRFRKRQDSGSSDILVLSHHPYIHTFPSQESDIAVLSNPSETSITVIDSAVSSRDTLDDIEDVWEGSSSELTSQQLRQPMTSAFINHKHQSCDLGVTGNGESHKKNVHLDPELSPSGSLTNKTLSSMISSVYEKSMADVNKIVGESHYVDDQGGDDTVDGVTVVSIGNESSSFHGDSSTPKVNQDYNPFHEEPHQNEQPAESDIYGSKEEGSLTPTAGSFLDKHFPLPSHVMSPEIPGKIKFSNSAFTQVDHRLKLYLMMSEFSQENEDLSLIIRCGLYQYSKDDEYSGLMIMSSHRIYLYRIKGAETTDHIDKWLRLVQSYPFSELRYVDIGMGYQTMTFDFGSESYKLIIRDSLSCKTFTAAFTRHLKHIVNGPDSQLEGIAKNNPVTTQNLKEQVLEECDVMGMDGDEDKAAGSVVFLMAHQHTGEVNASGEKALTPVTVVITPQHIYLVVENHQWPVPRSAAEVNIKGQQFSTKDKQNITDISSVDLDHTSPLDLNIEFFDEEKSEECTWRIRVETRSTMEEMIDTLRNLWEAQYGVELQVNIIDGDT